MKQLFWSNGGFKNVVFAGLDIQECSSINPCLNNGTCFNNNGSYSCQCTDGWQGQNCEKGGYI